MKVLLFALVFCSSLLEAHNPDKVPIHPKRKFYNTQFLDNEIDKHPRNRPIPFQVTYYHLNIEANPDSGKVEGTSSLSIQSRMKDLESILIDAYDMKIHSVTVNKENLRFTYDGEILHIHLNKVLAFQEKADIDIQYTASRSQSFFQAGADIIDPGNMKSAYTYTEPEDSRKWFPCIDRPFIKAPFDIRVRVPEKYKVLSNGTLMDKKSENAFTHYHYSMKEPIAPYLVSLAIGDYELLNIGDYQGKALSLWVPSALKQAALYDTARTAKMMEIFGRFTGVEYPFPSYAQSIAPAWQSSMEHQGATTLGSWVITGERTGESTIAHELAHQWFGDYVTPEVWSDLWLSEGFSTFMPYMFYQSIGEDIRALAELDDFRESYFTDAKKAVHALSPLNPDIDNMFDTHAYDKGALILNYMHFLANLTPSLTGEDNFQKAVKLYLETHAKSTVRNMDLQRSLESVTGHSWQIFFDQWIRSAGHPILEVEYKQEDNKLLLQVKQKHALDETKKWPTYQMSVYVDVYAENGSHVRKLVNIYDNVQDIVLDLPFKVSAVDMNPNWDLPSEITLQQDEKAWMLVLQHSKSQIAQVNAMRSLLAKTPIANEALLKAVEQSSSLYLKAMTLDKLILKNENKDFAIQLIRHMEVRKSEWDRIIRTSVANTDLWMTKLQGVAQLDELKLQEEYRNSSLYVHERKVILDKLVLISLNRAQAFAMERLKEAHWPMRDRANIVDLISKSPNAGTEDFLKKAFEGSSYYWLRRIVGNLVSVKYENKELIAPLVQRAQTDHFLSSRQRAIEFLSTQKESKELVCPILLKVSKEKEENPDRLDDLREAAQKGVDALKCQ